MQRYVLVGLFAMVGCDRVFNLEDVHGALMPDAEVKVGYAGAVLADHPIGYWRLGVSSMAGAVDESGRGTTGSLVGGVLPGATGALVGDPDAAMQLDGVDDRVTIASVATPNLFDFAGTAPFSIEAWVRPAGHGNYNGVVSKTDEMNAGNDKIGYHLIDQFSKFGFERTDGTNYQAVFTATALPIDIWSYAVVTYDGMALTLYVDGLVKSISTEPVSLPSTTNPLTIGARFGGQWLWFAGTIDEVAIYGYALEEAQLQNHRRVALGQ